jgi:sortase A
VLQDRGFRGFGRLQRWLLIFGISLVSLYLGNLAYSAVYSRASVQSFWISQASAQTGAAENSPRQGSLPDLSLWSVKRIKAYQASLLANVPTPLGVLDIPSLRLQVPILEGTDDLTLDRAVGHIPGTALLSDGGNVGIAGHRDGFFRALKDIHVGDVIDLHSQQSNTRYLVDEIEIVSPDDVSVLKPRGKSSLTLVTCYPFYFVGSAPLRYIVHASLADKNQQKTSEQMGMRAKTEANGRAD